MPLLGKKQENTRKLLGRRIEGLEKYIKLLGKVFKNLKEAKAAMNDF